MFMRCILNVYPTSGTKQKQVWENKNDSFVTEFPYVFSDQVNLSVKEVWATIYASEHN